MKYRTTATEREEIATADRGSSQVSPAQRGMELPRTTPVGLSGTFARNLGKQEK